MAHVELTAYPFPEGVTVPRLMPFQELPFNGDRYAAAEVLRLSDKHDLTYAVETGTCLGSTTLFLSDHFNEVTTFEAHDPYLRTAMVRGSRRTNITWIAGSSAKNLSEYAGHGFYFLDAHWGPSCPLLEELKIIAAADIRPVIMIHDFQVPDRSDLGFDCFPDGRPFSLKAVAPYLDNIYGMDGWSHHFNDQAEGAARGILYVEPT